MKMNVQSDASLISHRGELIPSHLTRINVIFVQSGMIIVLDEDRSSRHPRKSKTQDANKLEPKLVVHRFVDTYGPKRGNRHHCNTPFGANNDFKYST